MHIGDQDVVPGWVVVPYPISFSLQDLAWAMSYYARFFITYVPFYGILGAVLFLNFIRYLRLALTGL